MVFYVVPNFARVAKISHCDEKYIHQTNCHKRYQIETILDTKK